MAYSISAVLARNAYRFTGLRCIHTSFNIATSYQVPYQVVQRLSIPVTRDINKSLLSDRLISPKRPSCDAVIFDKDGTLIGFDKMWLPWADYVARNISTAGNVDLKNDIFHLMGVCTKTNRIRPGLLAEGTSTQIRSALVDLLLHHNLDHEHAASFIDKCLLDWKVLPEHIDPVSNIKCLLTTLRQHAIRVCICTSDGRANTMENLFELDILHLVDVIICGDDPDTFPKPEPHNAYLICKKLGVLPQNVVMVGDTTTDVMFAKNAKLGRFIGVLSGVGRRGDLEGTWFHSDSHESATVPSFHIVDSVADVLPLVLPDSPVPISSNRLALGSRKRPHQYKLIIVDKDGSLTDVHPRWSRWAEEIFTRLRVHASEKVAEEFLNLLGYSPLTRQVSGGILADCSVLRIKDSLTCLLMLEGWGPKKSMEIVEQVWFLPDLSANDVMAEVGKTIRTLKQMGLKVTINSCDTSAACDSFLTLSGLKGEMDFVLSADDAGHYPKPLPHSVLKIIKRFNLKPNEVIVVGDSPADLISGRGANVGLTIGLLSGYSMAHNLLPFADLLLPNVTYLPRLLQQLENSP